MMLPDFPRRQKVPIALGLLLLAGLAFFINLGSYPLFLEEPRRALIALEMYLSDQWMVPTQFGEAYFKKPPVWNWLILFSDAIFGGFSEWSVRYFGVVSFLLMGIITWWLGDKYVSFSFGLHAAALVLTMADALFYLTVVAGEIDLFYSLITYASIALIFFLREKGEYGWMFFIGYLLAAVGLLTKGLPSLVFLGITLLVALWDGYRLRKLWTFEHVLGLITFTVIVGWFSWSYQQHGEVTHYITTLWSESRDKTAVGGSFDLSRFSMHLLTFPLETFKNLLPGSLLLVFVLRKGFWDQIRSHRLIRFSLRVAVANIILYWLSPDTGSRYLYMLYPFFIVVLLYGYYTMKEHSWRDRVFKTSGLVILGAFTVVCAIYPFNFLELPLPADSKVLSVFLCLVMLFLTVAFLRWSQWRLLTLIVGCFCIRILFNFSVHEIRATDSPMLTEKNRGIEMAGIAAGEPMFIYQDTRISYTSAFYATRENATIIQKTTHTDAPGLYLISGEWLKEIGPHEVLYQLPYRKETVYLVRCLRVE